jgi:hypothetical protein
MRFLQQHGMAQACHIPIQLNLTDRHFKRHFSPNGTLPPRPAHRQPRDNSLKPRCFPRNLALRSARFPAIPTLARAQAESTHRLWPKPVRVCESSRLEKIEPPSRCPWRGAGRCKVTINHQIGGRCWMTAHGREYALGQRSAMRTETRPSDGNHTRRSPLRLSTLPRQADALSGPD